MKVLYYCDYFKRYTSKLIFAFAEGNPIATVVVRSETAEYEGRRTDEHSLHERLIEKCDLLVVLPGRYRSREAARRLMRHFYHERRYTEFDVFHLQLTQDPRFLLIAWRLPTVLTVHEPRRRLGHPGWDRKPRRIMERAIKQLYRRFSDVIVVHTESGLRSLSPAEARKACVIPHGVDIREVRNHENSLTILFFGRVEDYKGLGVLLEAMNHVWKALPETNLRILASPGGNIEQWKKAELDPRIRATWGGYTEQDLEFELTSARAVCMPYLSASGSGVLADAIGAEKLIVASNLEELRQFAAHPDLLVEPGSPIDLARALIAVLSNDYWPTKADPRTTWSVVASRHLSIYESLLRRPRGRHWWPS